MSPDRTLYDVLKIPVASSFDEVEAAHQRLSQQLREPGAYGLDKDEAQSRLKAIDEAYWILSDKNRRAHYDAVLSAKSEFATQAPSPKLLNVEKIRPVIKQAPRVLTIVNGSLKAVLLVVLIGFLLLVLFRSSWNTSAQREAELAQAQRIKAQEAALENGGRSAEEIAAEKIEADRRRQERERQEEERKHARHLAEERRYANQVSEQLRRDEERMRREQEQQARQAAYEEQRRRQEEERRAEQQQRRWEQILHR